VTTRLAYIDAIAGLAGDMLLGALLHAGADLATVRDGLQGLGVDGVELTEAKVHRHGILASSVTTVAAPEPNPPHRTWAEIRRILDDAGLPERALARAQAVFAELAEAEGRVHGVAADEVEFHEVGGLDSIGDICGIALALEDLGIDELACSALPSPRGFVDAAHGRLPLPAPATLELLRGVPIYGVELEFELVTPTGAAVVRALATHVGALPPMRLDAIGYGAGTRDLDACPNLVRVLVGEPVAPSAPGQNHEEAGRDEAVLIEANLDDLSPELVPDAAERCFAAGALDVWVTPVGMKKSRPGVVFSALARPADERAVASAILRETTTLGLRVSPVRRWELDRGSVTVDVGGEPVRIKLGLLDGETINASPEHDDCAAVARRTGRPVKAVWAAALAAAEGVYDR
jgi:pyridinium-3,5-bisthiocarboxylic acid mononucleotide nickel chelatase